MFKHLQKFGRLPVHNPWFLRKKIYLIRLFTWGQGLIRPASFSFFFFLSLSLHHTLQIFEEEEENINIETNITQPFFFIACSSSLRLSTKKKN